MNLLTESCGLSSLTGFLERNFAVEFLRYIFMALWAPRAIWFRHTGEKADVSPQNAMTDWYGCRFLGWIVPCSQRSGLCLQVPDWRPLARPNTLCLPSCLHSPAAHMATAQHCAGGRVGQRRALIGAQETAAPRPQEVHCEQCSTQSGAVKAAVESRQEWPACSIYTDQKTMPEILNILSKRRQKTACGGLTTEAERRYDDLVALSCRLRKPRRRFCDCSRRRPASLRGGSTTSCFSWVPLQHHHLEHFLFQL